VKKAYGASVAFVWRVAADNLLSLEMRQQAQTREQQKGWKCDAVKDSHDYQEAQDGGC
jgi:hypothetical protein